MAVANGSGQAKGRNSMAGFGFKLTRESTLLLVILVTVGISAFIFPTFFSFENFSAIMRNLALDAIMCCGMMILMVSGVFDLSVGSVFSLGGVLTAYMMKKMGLPVPAAILIGLALVTLCGLINGFITARIKVNALITTLGTQQIFRGASILIGGTNIPFLPAEFAMFGQTKILGLQAPVWIMVVIAIISGVLLAQSRFFRQFYFIGGNQRAAKLSGINVQNMQIVGFAIMSLLAGLAGMLFAARLGTAVTVAGDGKELQIITATILGGASLSGGKGSVIGALIGVVFIALVNNIMILSRLQSEWQGVVIGTILIVAVASDWLVSRSK
jgi:ribose transport system permease protein